MYERAARLRGAMKKVSRYWDWVPRADPQIFYEYWDGTAPTHHLYGLRAALDMIAEEGLQNVWRRHEILAGTYWAACETWKAGDQGIVMNVADPSNRSRAVTALRMPSPQATALREWCEGQAGVTLGIGLGMAPPGDPAWHGFFRVGHMGHVNAHMVLGVIGTIEAGLTALQIPMGGSGAAAASAHVAQSLS